MSWFVKVQLTTGVEWQRFDSQEEAQSAHGAFLRQVNSKQVAGIGDLGVKASEYRSSAVVERDDDVDEVLVA